MTGISLPNTNIALMQASLNRANSAASDTTVKNLPGHGIDEKTWKKLDRAATEFESVFIAEMLKPMFEGIEVDDVFGGGKGEEVFRDMMIQEYGKKITEAGGIGLASHIREELIRQQEGVTP